MVISSAAREIGRYENNKLIESDRTSQPKVTREGAIGLCAAAAVLALMVLLLVNP